MSNIIWEDKNIDLANKSECPTCHQTLHDNKLLTELNNKLTEKQNNSPI